MPVSSTSIRSRSSIRRQMIRIEFFLDKQWSDGLPVEPLTEYRVGTMFVRISLDQIADLARLRP